MAERCLTRRHLRDIPTVGTIVSSPADTLDHPPSASKCVSSAHPSLERGLSLRLRSQHSAAEAPLRDKPTVVRGKSGQTFPGNSAVTQHSTGVECRSAAACEDSAAFTQKSRSNPNQSSTVGAVSTLDTDGHVVSSRLSAGSVTVHAASNSFDDRVAVRRRLGMTSRTFRQPSVTRRHSRRLDDVAVSVCPTEPSGARNQSDTRDESDTPSSVSRSPMRVDTSFAELAEGLRRIPGRHRDGGGAAAVSEVHRKTEGRRRLQRPRSSPQQTRARGRNQRTDHDRPRSRNDSGVIRVETGDGQSPVKDCVVVLERSADVEKLLETAASCTGSDTKILSQTVAADKNHTTEPLSAATSLSSSSSSLSLLFSSADKCDQRHRRLSLRKSPQSDSSFCSPSFNTVSADRETDLCSENRLADNLTSVDHKSKHLSDTPARVQVAGSADSRPDVSRDISAAVGRRRLKRRKVCLRLTGSRGDGPGFGTMEVTAHCVLGRNATGHGRRIVDEAVVGQMEVISAQPDPDLSLSGYERDVCSTDKPAAFNTEVTSRPDPHSMSVTRLKYAHGSEAEVVLQPDPDFSPSYSVAKRAKTAAVTLSESVVGRSESMLRPDPDSRQLIETNGGAKKDGTDIGQAKVTLQPCSNFPTSLSSTKCLKKPMVNLGRSEVTQESEPDLSHLTHLKCVSAVNDESLIGQAEVMSQSAPDRLQPDPDYSQQLADTADFLHDRCTDAMYRLALFSSPEISDADSSPPVPSSPTGSFPGEVQIQRPVDDAGECLSDSKTTSWAIVDPGVRESDEMMADTLPRTSDCSASMLSSPCVSEMISTPRSSRDDGEDFAQKLGLVAEENAVVTTNGTEESSTQMENLGLVPVNCMDVRRTKCDPAPVSAKLFEMAKDYDEYLNQSENVIIDTDANADVRNRDIGSTPSLEESALRMADCSGEGSLSKSGNVLLDFVDHDVGKNSSSNESRPLCESAVEDVVVLRPESYPPSRQLVLFDLATSSRSSLLQSARDAFCSDAGDLPSRARYVVMPGIYRLANSNVR